MARSRNKVTVDQLIEQFLFHLGDRRCSEATLRWHRHHLGRFAEWANARSVSPFPSEWEKDDQDRLLFRRYLSDAGRRTTSRGKPMSAASLKSTRSSLRSFCRWMVETDRVRTDFLEGTSSPRLPQTLKQGFTQDEVKRLLAAVAAHSRNPRRDAALIRFMLDTGCRAAEVCGLLAADVDWSDRSAKVFGKGSKERFVFFSPGVADAMRRYASEERSGRSPYFFQSEGKNAGAKLTPSGLLALCKRLGAIAGVHAHPHRFRHTFAISYLRAGGDVFSLQKRLGHTTLTMSEHYAKHVTDDLKREHDEHSPDQLFFGAGGRRAIKCDR